MAIDPSLCVASVHLAVSDLARSADFYEHVLGLPSLGRSEGEALLGAAAGAGEQATERAAALRLSAIPSAIRAPARSTGLFHVAWLHPTRAALADTVQRVIQGGWRIDGAADHGVSEALYLSDPDGLGIEIYADRPREQWARPPGGHGVEMVTLALDIEDLLAQSPGPPSVEADGETFIGHVHMKVADVPRANAFYRDMLGFEEQAMLPSAAFLSAGGYHHHIGLNSWQSRGSERAPDEAPGLREVTFELGSADTVEALQEELSDLPLTVDRGDGALSLHDPDGQLLRFTA